MVLHLTLSYRRAFSQALVEAGRRMRDVVVVDADVSRSTGTLQFAERYPDRFVTVGISEQDMVSTAAGLALAGKIPVAVTFAMFLMRGWEQIRNVIARDMLNVKLVGTHAGLSAHVDGSSHQCLEDLAAMRAIPNMTVVVPADARATYMLTLQALEEHVGPLYMRLGRDNSPQVYSEGSELKIGRATLMVEGHDAYIVACGPMVGVALGASEILRSKGLSVGVVDLHTIKPVDRGIIVRCARETGLIVTLEEHNVVGGMGSAVVEVLAEEYPVPTLKLGIPDSFGTSARNYLELLEHFGLTPERVAEKVEVTCDVVKARL